MSVLIEQRCVDHAAYQALCAANIQPLLARLFAARQVKTLIETQHTLTALLRDDQLKNAQKAAQLLADAIFAGKRIRIVGDYDADGATATALAVRVLRLMGACVDFCVPNRLRDGYGMSPTIVDDAKHEGIDLLVTVDNGIAAHQAIAHAQSLGIAVIVTDHHLPAKTLPDCLIVNPNQPGCIFPCKSLAGVGVMFYVLIALRRELSQRGQDMQHLNLGHFLDLVALGTVADVVPLEHNNRILVHAGLKRIQSHQACAGIRALFQVAQKDPQQAKSYDLGFSIGPRINAAGRLNDMSLGIRCLITDDDDEASQLAETLNQLNQKRRQIEKDMLDEAQALAQEVVVDDNHLTLCVYHQNWHAGVMGIVASRLREQFQRPSIVFAPSDDGNLQGSGRSVRNLHLRDALDLVNKRYPNLIKRFGGHAMAAGLTIDKTDFPTFQQAFEHTVASLIDAKDLIPCFHSDGSLNPSEISLQNAQLLAKIVWGQGFEEPRFDDVFTVTEQKIVGNNHSKLLLEKDGHFYEAMLFKHTETLPPQIRIIYRLVANRWKNSETLQLYIDYWQNA